MKALSLWQPWATAIALGAKRIETRHWPTNYRGPLAIHAAKRCVKSELHEMAFEWEWAAVFWPLVRGGPIIDVLPFGAIVATCTLVDCVRTESLGNADLDVELSPDDSECRYGWTERSMGNFEPGRFGWVLKNVRPLSKPIPWRGAQGLFDVPDEVLTP